LGSKLSVTSSTAATATRTTPTSTRYNKVVSKDSRRTSTTSKKNLEYARHL
jgi:hypothetical protein